MKDTLRRTLQERFGERASFHPTELLLYSHDVGSIPRTVERLIDNLPEAVVQPMHEEEVSLLVRLARQHGVPLVPRGAATSGYGGAVPAKSGLVVDFSRMDHLLAVDAEAQTVTVQPGVIWQSLERELAPHGLMARLYPTSAPGSTVAGWVAEGGSGIGSYEYGAIEENVVAIRIVRPDGQTQLLSGDEMALASRAEGITGLITEVTLRTRPLDETVTMLAAFTALSQVSRVVEEIKRANLPLWHVALSTAAFVQASHLADARAADGGHDEPPPAVHVSAPLSHHLLLFAFPGSREPRIADPLRDIVRAAGGSMQPASSAQQEWEHRFYPMRMKRLGPSLIPSEGILPARSLAPALAEAQARLQGIAIEGSMVGKDDFTLLCFLPHDERTAAFTLGFAKSLTMLDIIEKYGGRPYSAGLYFTDKARTIFGQERLALWSTFKGQCDPDNLLNPGKILPGSGNPLLLRSAMRIASSTQPLLDVADRFVSHNPKTRRHLPEILAQEAFICAQCGYCRSVCTLYGGRRWESSTPRGKWLFLRHYLQGDVAFDQEMVHAFLLCTTCKRCNDACQLGIPIQELWDDMRGVLVQDMARPTFPAFEMMAASWARDRNIWAGRREERDAWVPDGVEYLASGKLGYWAGCTASFVESDIAVNAVRILKEGEVPFAYLGKDEGCCGMPFLASGKWDVFEAALRQNLEQIEQRGIETLLISCPGCWVAWQHYYPLWARKLGLPYRLKIKHITELTSELIKEGKLEFKQPLGQRLTWHDPCHIGRHGGIYDAPREALRALPGVEFVEMASCRADGRCCGSVLTRVGDPETSNHIAAARLSEAEDVSADAVVTTCPCCEFQLRVGADETGKTIRVTDFAAVVNRAMGYETKDPDETVLYMWSVFEDAIAAMSVEGMVEMMAALMPEIMAAMPGMMHKGMGVMQALPGPIQSPALKMMEKMVPMMMPGMLPDMMPALMPRVVELMKSRIPNMPPSMVEALPEMLPRVMARIMPTMLPEAAPQLAPRMTAYLKKK